MINKETDVICKNRSTQYEVVGKVASLIYDDEYNLVGYEVTNNCNELDVYVEDYILFTEWNIERNMKEIIHAQLELKMIAYDTEEERDIHIKEMNNKGWQIKRFGEYNLCSESTVTAYCDKNNWSYYAEYFKEQQSNIKDENISYESEMYWFDVYNEKEES